MLRNLSHNLADFLLGNSEWRVQASQVIGKIFKDVISSLPECHQVISVWKHDAYIGARLRVIKIYDLRFLNLSQRDKRRFRRNGCDSSLLASHLSDIHIVVLINVNFARHNQHRSCGKPNSEKQYKNHFLLQIGCEKWAVHKLVLVCPVQYWRILLFCGINA